MPPADLIFDALTKPELIQRWCLGPLGWTMPVCEIDLKVGGAWKYVWRSDEDGCEFDMSGESREIKRPDRIVHTGRFGEGESLVTSVLQEKDRQTTLTMTMRFVSKEARDGAIAPDG
ncbi:MAG: SRPBCC domain-containing protein [Chthoniobacterales bacterium]